MSYTIPDESIPVVKMLKEGRAYIIETKWNDTGRYFIWTSVAPLPKRVYASSKTKDLVKEADLPLLIELVEEGRYSEIKQITTKLSQLLEDLTEGQQDFLGGIQEYRKFFNQKFAEV
jgi:hypothetical protein